MSATQATASTDQPPAFLRKMLKFDEDGRLAIRPVHHHHDDNEGEDDDEDEDDEEEPPSRRPYVTLTFAQSLDAKIAGRGGQQLILSGKESMVMTHWMRTMHDGILVGINTVLNDDPQLNTRHLPPRSDCKPHPLPQPIVLDPQLRTPPKCKLLKNFKVGTGRQPLIIWNADNSTTMGNQPDPPGRKQFWQRMRALEDAGAVLYGVGPQERGTDHVEIHISVLLKVLHGRGIKSVMVEGGARVIESFLDARDEGLVDSVIITIAPTVVGGRGVAYNAPPLHLRHIATEQVGRDTVMAFQ